jgi:hypothetical protein
MPVIGSGCQSESLMHEESVLRMVSMESFDLAAYIVLIPVTGSGCQSESLMHEESVLRMVSMESCDWLLIFY